MALGRPEVALILTDDERVRLNSLAHRSSTAPHLARPARIILACAEGQDNQVVAKRLRMSQTTVQMAGTVSPRAPRRPVRRTASSGADGGYGNSSTFRG